MGGVVLTARLIDLRRRLVATAMLGSHRPRVVIFDCRCFVRTRQSKGVARYVECAALVLHRAGVREVKP